MLFAKILLGTIAELIFVGPEKSGIILIAAGICGFVGRDAALDLVSGRKQPLDLYIVPNGTACKLTEYPIDLGSADIKSVFQLIQTAELK